jgi:hypothetical protein
MSFGSVNQQHRRGLLCNDMIRRFRRSPTTCIGASNHPVASILNIVLDYEYRKWMSLLTQ